MSHAVQHNLPIFSKGDVMPFNGKFYVNVFVGFDNYLGCMKASPRKDYFAFIEDGIRIGRLDCMEVMRKKVESNDKILMEVIPNKYGSIIDSSEFIPKMKSGYLSFSTGEVKMSFFDWVRFMTNKLN